MDGRSGAAFDLVTAEEVQITGVLTKTNSTVPFGLGSTITAAEAAGLVTFNGTNFAANYASQNGATVIAAQIEIEPNATTGFPASSTVFDNQYWVVHRHGSGSFSATTTFTVTEDLTTADASVPGQIHLYGRDKGSAGDWNFIAAASSVDAANDQAVFSEITAFDRQFILARFTDPFLSARESSLPFGNIKVGCSYQQYSYDLLGTNLAGNVSVTPPSDFLVSTEASSGFVSSLSLTPTAGTVAETIYVRHDPTATGTFSGTVVNSSTGATTKNVALTEFMALEIEDYAAQAMDFDGSNDYLVVQDFNWNPVNVFSVEWWLKPDSYTSWNQQIGNGWGNFLFYTSSDGSVSVGITNNDGSRINSAPGELVLGEWQHFAYTLDGNHAKLYKNGELLGETNSSWGYNQNWGEFNIGRNSSSTLNGQLDEFRMWSTARTQQEIRDNMHNVLAGDETGLKLYLQFNAETGDAVDFSNNCYVVETNNDPARTISTAAVGTVGELLKTQTATGVGEPGKQMTVTISSTVTITDYLGIYRTGTGTQLVTTETFPDGVTWRSNIFWGLQEFGEVAATLVFDYTNVYDTQRVANVQLLKRADATSPWTDVTADFVHDPVNHTFTKTGVMDYSEYSIGGVYQVFIPLVLR